MDNTLLTWQERSQLWLRLGLRAVLLAACAALVIFVGLPLLSLFSPFVFALVLAWLLNPAVRWLQRRTKISRKVISMVLVILVFAVIGGVLFGLGWMAVDQVRSLFDNRQTVLDSALSGLLEVVNDVQRWLAGLNGVVPDEVITTSEDLIGALANWVQGLDYDRWLAQMAGQAPSMAANVSGFAVALVVFMMASYFITGDYPRLRFELTDRVPMVTRDFCRSVKEIFMSAFGGYIKSQLILSLGVFIILAIGFFFMRQPYSLLLALGLAVLDFIPIIGAGTVMVPWAVVDMVLGQYGEAAALMAVWGDALPISSLSSVALSARSKSSTIGSRPLKADSPALRISSDFSFNVRLRKLSNSAMRKRYSFFSLATSSLSFATSSSASTAPSATTSSAV